jgi:hypothetical protein
MFFLHVFSSSSSSPPDFHTTTTHTHTTLRVNSVFFATAFLNPSPFFTFDSLLSHRFFSFSLLCISWLWSSAILHRNHPVVWSSMKK